MTKLDTPVANNKYSGSIVSFSKVDHATSYNIEVDGEAYGTFTPALTTYRIAYTTNISRSWDFVDTSGTYVPEGPGTLKEWSRVVIHMKANLGYRISNISIQGSVTGESEIPTETQGICTVTLTDPSSDVKITVTAVSLTPTLSSPTLSRIENNKLYGTDVANATAYTIRANLEILGTSTSKLSDGIDLTTLENFASLSPLSSYSIYAKARAAEYTDSDWSDNFIDYTPPAKHLAAPQNLTITNKKLSWSGVSKATDGTAIPQSVTVSYIIYAKTTTNSYIELGTSLATSTDDVTLLTNYDQLTTGTAYQLCVVAVSNSSAYLRSDYSSTVDFTAVPKTTDVLSAPTHLSIADHVLSWTAVTTTTDGVSLPSGVIVTYTISILGESQSTTTTSTSIDLTQFTLQTNTRYTVLVSATADSYTKSASSDIWYTPTTPITEPTRFWIYGGVYKIKEGAEEFPFAADQIRCILNCVIINSEGITYNTNSENCWGYDSGLRIGGYINEETSGDSIVVGTDDMIYFGFSAQEIICTERYNSETKSIEAAKQVYEWCQNNLEEVVDISAQNYIRLKQSSLSDLTGSIPENMMSIDDVYFVRLSSYVGFSVNSSQLYIEKSNGEQVFVEEWGDSSGGDEATDLSSPYSHIEYIQPGLDCSYPTLSLSDNLQTKFTEMMGYQLGLESGETGVEYHDYGLELIQSWYESAGDNENGGIYLFNDNLSFTGSEVDGWSPENVSTTYAPIYDENNNLLLPSFEAIDYNLQSYGDISVDPVSQMLNILSVNTQSQGNYRTISYYNDSWRLRDKTGNFGTYSIPIQNRVIAWFYESTTWPEALLSCVQSTYSGAQAFYGRTNVPTIVILSAATPVMITAAKVLSAAPVMLTASNESETWSTDLSGYSKYASLTLGQHRYRVKAVPSVSDYSSSDWSNVAYFVKLADGLMINQTKVKSVYSGNNIVKAIYQGEKKVYDGAVRITVAPFSSSSGIELVPSYLEFYVAEPDVPRYVNAWKDGVRYTDPIYEGFYVYQGQYSVTNAPIEVTYEGGGQFGIVLTDMRPGESYIVKLRVS